MPSPDPCPGGEGGHPLGASLLGASILAPLALGVPTLVFFYKLTTEYGIASYKRMQGVSC